MPKFCLRLHSLLTVALIALAAGCSSISPFNITKNGTSVWSAETPCPQIDLLTKATNKAWNAAILAREAQSKQDWDLVASRWIQAIDALQAIPADSPRRAFAQKKVTEYLQNLRVAQQKAATTTSQRNVRNGGNLAANVAQQKAATTTSQLPFSSFNNPILDDQLLLYLSYIASVGTPDILIVGSSRALVGIDPRQLQQALATQGKGGLKIFNFAVNGATAQIVDFQLRQLLTPEQLPRLILWADGVRAFNSGRTDRTYNSLVASAGYQHLMVGDRPTLPPSQPEFTDDCDATSSTPTSSTTTEKSNAVVGLASSTIASEGWWLARSSFKASSNPASSSTKQLPLTQVADWAIAQRPTTGRNIAGYSSFAIDAHGFLPLNSRFNPDIYYQKNPRVVGRYDADYQPFSLAGQQATALNSLKAFAIEQQIPLVFINLPLTQDYLDSVRRIREQQFQQFMQRQVSPGFVFINLGRQWLTQNQYFTDPSHLNRYGAAAVARQLAANSKIPWPQPSP